MPSNINPYNINGNYPIAGQDNDSQGFRDNFTNIRNNLAFAKSEMEDLQSKVVLKSALNGTSLSNDLGGSRLGGAQLINTTYAITDIGTVSGSVSLSYPAGNFQRFTTAGAVTLNFTNWPSAGILGSLRISMVITDHTHTISLPATVSLGIDSIANSYYNSITAQTDLIFYDAGTYQFELTSTDGGASYNLVDLSRGKASFGDDYFYKFRTTIDNKDNPLFVNFGKLLPHALVYEAGQNSIAVRGGISSYQTQANIGSNVWGNVQLSTGAELSVVSSRTLESAPSIPVPLHGGDNIGYFSAVGFTNPYTDFTTTGNTYVTMGALEWNTVTGNISLGSALNIYTKKVAGNVAVAINIDSNQNTTVSGNITVNGNTAGFLGNVYVGQNVTPGAFTVPVILAKQAGATYIQMSAQNSTSTGSADVIAYPDNGTDSSGWSDMGMCGSSFNDSNYTITKPNDGYFFVEGTSGKGGNLVIATGDLGGTQRDIIFATGGFAAANEKMRYIHTTGQFDIQPTTTSTSTSTGALRVRGGAGIAGNVYVGGVMNLTNVTTETYSYQTPTTGSTLTLAQGYRDIIIDPAGTLSSLTITMPIGVYDGQRLTIASSAAITTVTHNAGSGQTLKGGLTTLAANGFGTWIYRQSNTTWYRIG